MSSTLIDIFEDETNGDNIAVLCGKSLKSLDVARDEINKILNDYNSRIEENTHVEDNHTIRKDYRFPPGYGDNFSRPTLRRSEENIHQSGGENQSNIELNFGNNAFSGIDGQLNAVEISLENSMVSSSSENHWNTIKGGKIVKEEVLTDLKKKKKKKKKKDQNHNPTTDALKQEDN